MIISQKFTKVQGFSLFRAARCWGKWFVQICCPRSVIYYGAYICYSYSRETTILRRNSAYGMKRQIHMIAMLMWSASSDLFIQLSPEKMVWIVLLAMSSALQLCKNCTLYFSLEIMVTRLVRLGHKNVFTSVRNIEYIEQIHGSITFEQIIYIMYRFHRMILRIFGNICVKFWLTIITWRHKTINLYRNLLNIDIGERNAIDVFTTSDVFHSKHHQFIA